MIKKMSELLKDHSVKLSVNSTDSSRYSVLQYSGKGILNYSENGIGYYNYDEHYSNIESFLMLAQQNNSDLVITPEGSVPHNIIENIIIDKNKWPENNKLWCLCAEGITTEKFKYKISELKTNDNIILIFDEEVNYKVNVNALWYLLRINGKLGVVIQLKQHHMSDHRLEGEGKDLSTGNVTYCFDLDGNNVTKNILVSYICSDLIGLSATSIISELSRTHPIILSLQLNPKPFDEKFVNFRKTYFIDSSMSHQRMIVSNWGVGTTMQQSLFEINESGNAFFSKLDNMCSTLLKNVLQDKSTFEHRLILQKESIESYFDDAYSIWKINDEIEAVQYEIEKEENYNTCQNLGPLNEPIISRKYQFNNEKKSWIVDSRKYCNTVLYTELLDIFKKNEDYYLYELKMCLDDCECSQCTRLYCDFFFGICFGELIAGELEVKLEKSERALQFLNYESKSYSKSKLHLIKMLIKELEKDNFPKSMSYLVKNNIFEINRNAAETGSNEIYNLVPKKEEDKQKKAIVAICPILEKDEVRKIYKKLSLVTNERYSSQIIIYYLDDNNNFQVYEEPHDVTGIGISSPSFTKNTASIKGGLF